MRVKSERYFGKRLVDLSIKVSGNLSSLLTARLRGADVRDQRDTFFVARGDLPQGRGYRPMVRMTRDAVVVERDDLRNSKTSAIEGESRSRRAHHVDLPLCDVDIHERFDLVFGPPDRHAVRQSSALSHIRWYHSEPGRRLRTDGRERCSGCSVRRGPNKTPASLVLGRRPDLRHCLTEESQTSATGSKGGVW